MEIRKIKPEDIAGVVKLMRDFAEFENLGDYCQITDQKLSQAIFAPEAFVDAVVAVENDHLVGYAIFYPHFASFRGQSGFYLEDIFVDDRFRGQRVGESILRLIARTAAARGFERIDFQVLDWNTPAVNFYLKFGADRDDSERHFKFTDDAFRALAS